MLRKFQSHNRFLTGLALAGTVLLAACGGGGDGGRDPILGGGGTAVLIPQVSAVTPLANATGVPVNTSTITAAFNKAMDPTTITAATFTLACPAATAITGIVNYTATGNLATLALANNLPANAICTATVTTAAKDDTGNALQAAYVWNFTTGSASDAVAPTVSSTVPTLNASGVAPNARVTASFSEAMNPLTINAANFSLVCPTAAVTGTVAYTVTGNVLTFTPAQNLPSNAVCRATITAGARDVAGNAMRVPFTWTFTTVAALDAVAPTVISTLPQSSDTLVPTNSQISATFSEGMDPLTIIAANLMLECPAAAAITGTVGYAVSGNTATFRPNANLPANTVCRATVTTGARDLAGLPLGANYVWTFTTGPSTDTIAPTVSSTVPAANAASVQINSLVSASFSEPVNPLTISTVNFGISCPAGTPVTGTVRYAVDGNVAIFTPDANLPVGVTCRASISPGTGGVTDVAGNPLLNTYTWNFTTGLVTDTTAPQVSIVVPTNGATAVPLNVLVNAGFSEAMDPLTIVPPATFTVACPVGTPVTGVVSYALNSHIASFNPNLDLPASTLCRASITTGVRDLAGIAMPTLFTWSFTTGTTVDLVRPTVTLRHPTNGATNVAINTTVNATFSEAMDALTITTANFTLAAGATPIVGQLTYDAVTRIATFYPSGPLSPNTTHTATVTNNVRGVVGNNMLVSDTWTFTTGVSLAQGAVPLGNAATFGIMATSAITSIGATRINGDVSLQPGTSQGIPVAQVSGTINVNNAISTAARSDLLTAYNQLKALPAGTTVLGGTDLGASFPGPDGMAPGTYTSGSTMLVSTPLTLNGGGNANAVWVFQIGSSLTTAANIVLTNGAQAKNVFWVPTQDATVGVGTTFNGNIIAGRDTTTRTGVTVNGRLLSGAITAGTIALDSTTVNVPAP